MAEHVQLGRLLVQRGLVTDAQLEDALEQQLRTHQTLGRVLIELGVVREDDLVATLAQQVGYDFVDLTTTTISADAAALVPEAVARRHHALPIAWRGDRLVVAIADPSNTAAVDAIRAETGATLLPVVATRVAIDNALDALAAGEVPGRKEPVKPPDTEPARIKAGTLLLRGARAARATEVHVESQRDDVRIRYRIDGVLHDIERVGSSTLALLRQSLTELGAEAAESSVAAEFSLVTLPTVHGEAMIVRLHAPTGPPQTLDGLGLSADVSARISTMLTPGHGAVIVTGPAGSGVTSTLHAILMAADAPGRLLLAVEDPIERELTGVTQVLVGPDLPVVTTVRRALAARPDVILIGDVRDGASAAIAVEAALAGRFVAFGLTGRDAASTPGRLLSMGLEPLLLAGALGGVVAQRLVRRLCVACRASFVPSDAELEAIGWQEELDPAPALYRAVGCEQCHGIGYAGVTPIAEVLVMTDDLARLITMRANASDIQKLAIAQGMRPLQDAGLALVRDGITSITEIARVL